MRVFAVLILVLFLAGCSNNVKIEDYNLIEEYSEGNVTHYFEFTLHNTGLDDADCKARLDLGGSEKMYILGQIDGRSKRRFIVPFEMPDGEINISLEHLCSFE